MSDADVHVTFALPVKDGEALLSATLAQVEACVRRLNVPCEVVVVDDGSSDATEATLVTANGFLAITGIAAFLVIVARTSIEERKLIERFGHDYVEYAERTGRFLPRISR